MHCGVLSMATSRRRPLVAPIRRASANSQPRVSQHAHANRKGVGEAVGDRVRESQTLPVFIVTQLTLHVQLRARGFAAGTAHSALPR